MSRILRLRLHPIGVLIDDLVRCPVDWLEVPLSTIPATPWIRSMSLSRSTCGVGRKRRSLPGSFVNRLTYAAEVSSPSWIEILFKNDLVPLRTSILTFTERRRRVVTSWRRTTRRPWLFALSGPSLTAYRAPRSDSARPSPTWYDPGPDDRRRRYNPLRQVITWASILRIPIRACQFHVLQSCYSRHRQTANYPTNRASPKARGAKEGKRAGAASKTKGDEDSPWRLDLTSSLAK
jgi:hypothetical protein